MPPEPSWHPYWTSKPRRRDLLRGVTIVASYLRIILYAFQRTAELRLLLGLFFVLAQKIPSFTDEMVEAAIEHLHHRLGGGMRLWADR